MSDARQAEGSESRWPRVRPALEAIAIIGGVVLILARAGRLTRSEEDWALLVFGLLYAHHVATDVRRGRTTLQRYGDDPRYDYVRSADPIGFWVLIALKGAVAAAVAIGALGDLLGLWNWS